MEVVSQTSKVYYIHLFISTYLYRQVGHWRERTGVNMTRNFTETITEIVESLQNKTLVVTTIMVRSKWEHWRGDQARISISSQQSALTLTTGLPIYLHYFTRLVSSVYIFTFEDFLSNYQYKSGGRIIIPNYLQSLKTNHHHHYSTTCKIYDLI